MRQRVFKPTVTGLEARAMLDGEFDLAMAPPPEIDPAPPGGILGDPQTMPSGGDPTALPLPTTGPDVPPRPPEGDPSLAGILPENDVGAGVGPLPVGATPAF